MSSAMDRVPTPFSTPIAPNEFISQNRRSETGALGSAAQGDISDDSRPNHSPASPDRLQSIATGGDVDKTNRNDGNQGHADGFRDGYRAGYDAGVEAANDDDNDYAHGDAGDGSENEVEEVAPDEDDVSDGCRCDEYDRSHCAGWGDGYYHGWRAGYAAETSAKGNNDRAA